MVKKILIAIGCIMFTLFIIFFLILHLKNKNFYYTSNSLTEAKQKKSLVHEIENYSIKCMDKNFIKEIWIEKYHRRKNLFSSEFVYDSVYSLVIKSEGITKSQTFFYVEDSLDTSNHKNSIKKTQNGLSIFFDEKSLTDKNLDTIVIKPITATLTDKNLDTIVIKPCFEIKILMK